MIEFKALKYFVAVAEEMSFTKGALRERVSQPALSRQIKALEEELGVELILREQPIRLSPAGQQLLVRARHLLNEAVKTELSVRQYAACRLHRLDVGYHGHVGGELVGRLWGKFQQTYPEVKVVLHELTPGMQLEMLRAGSLDIALLGEGEELGAREVDWFELGSEELGVLIRSGHELSDGRDFKTHAWQKETWIRWDDAKFPGWTRGVEQRLAERGIKAKWSDPVDGWNGAQLLVASGQAIACWPKGATWATHLPLHWRPWAPDAMSSRYLAAVTKEERRRSVRNWLFLARELWL